MTYVSEPGDREDEGVYLYNLMNLPEKIRGCLLGGAIGDCLGGPYEGQSPTHAFIIPSNWQLTDDTQMSLATCEAISNCGEVDPAVIAATFATWFRNSRFSGLGPSTYKALSELSYGGHWALVGRKGTMAAGNGAAMRAAPLAFCLDPKDRQHRVRIRDVCRITHHNEEAYVGALAVVVAVKAAWDGTWTGGSDLIPLVRESLPDSNVRDRLIALSDIDATVPLNRIAERFGCSGYVVESVPLALYGAQRLSVSGFTAVLQELISLGGDSDTIASIAGQTMGGYLGESELPESERNLLPQQDEMIRIIDRFVATAVNSLGG
ncbi:MAG: ADP-ribosylglycohydrolase family protein [Blastocatellia bacterium]|nr:ADP-ribosylglycohydrolase family protein [Blastocatellia bacterium]